MMKIGLTSYSMNNYICDGIMSILDVMRFAKEKGAEHIELVPFGFTLHDDATGKFNEALIEEIKQDGKFKRQTLFTIVIKYLAPICIVAILVFSILEATGKISV